MNDDRPGDQRNQNGSNLLKHPALWRAGELKDLRQARETISSGFEILDTHLPGRGWPTDGLCELMLPTAGIGELQLLLPALRALSRQGRWIAWINAPFIPYAPALSAAGVDIGKILLIHPKSHEDALWALERATRSGNCSSTLAWLDERQLKAKDTRRLQLAARQGGTLACLFRPGSAREQNSMAELRLHLQAGAPGERDEVVVVDVCKRHGGWPLTGLRIPLHAERRPAEIREQLSLWREWRAWRGERQPAADDSDSLSPISFPHAPSGNGDRPVTH
jgi:cell division inhibitor SulA